MNSLLKWLTMAIAILISAYLIPGVSISGVWASLWLALFLGLINITLRPILIILTLPINIFSFGLFTFVINALMILLSASVIKGFFVESFFSALFFSIVLSLISFALNNLMKKV